MGGDETELPSGWEQLADPQGQPYYWRGPLYDMGPPRMGHAGGGGALLVSRHGG